MVMTNIAMENHPVELIRKLPIFMAIFQPAMLDYGDYGKWAGLVTGVRQGEPRLVLAAVENDWRALQFAAASLRRRYSMKLWYPLVF